MITHVAFDESRMKYLYLNNGYFADIDGNIYNRRGRKLKPVSRWAYDKVSLPVDGKIKDISIHRLIATTFIPNPENKPQVNHKDGNKRNNKVSNLEWVTASENQRHAVLYLGKSARGTKNSQCKLSEEQVLNIMKCHKNGMDYKDIAKLFNMSPTTIHGILRGYSWTHITHLPDIKKLRKEKK